MLQYKKNSIYSYLFTIYLTFILMVWGNEFVDAICFTVGIKQGTLISRILVLVAITGSVIYLMPKVKIVKAKVNVFMVIGIIIISLIGILKSVYPDVSFDTLHYHLINQRPGFTDYFEQHFGKGNFQIWGFRLGDRLFYSFQCLFGYRLGTLLNVIVLIILYIQINELLKIVNENKICRAIGALIILLTHDAVLMIGTYYVDILPLPIALEILRKLLEASKQEQDSRDILYFALLNGIWFAFKMTNIVFVAPCVLMYIFLVRKQLSLKNFLVSAMLAALPCSIYLLYAFQCTGNPIFPYFNTLFESDFFQSSSFKDGRWGGITFFEKIFWLFYMIFYPNYRQSEIPNTNTLLFVIGLLGIMLICIDKIKKKNCTLNEFSIIAILLLCSSLTWSFSTGYSRYFIFGMLLLGILAYYFVVCLWQKNHKIVVFGMCSLLLLQTADTIKDFYLEKNWTWTLWTKDTFIEQCSRILSDKEYENVNSDIDMFYLTNSMYAGIADTVNTQAYTFNAFYANYLDNDKLAIENLQSHQDLLTGNVYDIYKRNLDDIKDYVENLNTHNMIIKRFEKYDNSIGGYELIKIEYSDVQSNDVYVGEEILDISMQSLATNDNASLNLICGRFYDWEYVPICEMAILKNNEEICRVKIDNSLIENHEIYLGTLVENDVITIDLYYENGEIFDEQLNKVFILNPTIE